MDFLKDLLSQPAIIAGIVVLIGLLALRKPATEVVTGTVKAMLGMVILSAGASLITGALTNFSSLFEGAFNMKGIVPSNEAGMGITLGKFGTIATFVFVFGLVLDIVLARFTKFKFIFLSSDHALYMACAITPFLMLTGLDTVPAIVCGSLILGVILATFPAMVHEPMKKITGDNCSFAHFGTIGYWFAAQLGKLVGKNSASIEELHFPMALNFLSDSNVSVSLVMAIMFFLVTGFAPADTVAELAGGQNQWVWAFFQALNFAAGIYVLVAGVNVLLEEITPAFRGFSEKIVPNAVPAYPFAVLFKGTSNALIAGFLLSMLGGVVAMGIQIACGLPVVLFASGIVFHFFCGGLGAIFGNVTGGRRGALIGPFIVGFIMTWTPILTTSLLGAQFPEYATTFFSDADFNVVAIVLGALGQMGPAFIYVLTAVAVLFPFVATALSKTKSPDPTIPEGAPEVGLISGERRDGTKPAASTDDAA